MPILLKHRRASKESSASDAHPQPAAAAAQEWPCPPSGFYVRVFCAADRILTPDQALEWLEDRGVYLWVDSIAKSPAGGVVTKIEVPAPGGKAAEPPRFLLGEIAKIDTGRKRVLLGVPAHEAGRYDSAFLRYSNKTKILIDGKPARIAHLKPDMQVAVTLFDSVIVRIEVGGNPSPPPAQAPARKEEIAKGVRVKLVRVDYEARTITVAKLPGDVAPSGPTVIKTDAKTEILLDGKPEDLSTLEARHHIVVTPAAGVAARIVATSPGAHGAQARHATIVKVNAKKLLITVSVTSEEGALSQDIVVANEFTQVFIHNKPAQLSDLKPGQHIIVIPLDGIATRIEVPPEGSQDQPSLRATILSIDDANKTITAEPLADEEQEANEATLTLDSKVAVFFHGKGVRLVDLRPNQEVVISGPQSPFTIRWQRATFRWNRRDSQIQVECEHCESPDSTGSQEVTWFQAHFASRKSGDAKSDSTEPAAAPAAGTAAANAPADGAARWKFPQALRGLVARCLGRQRRRVLHHLGATKVVILTKIGKTDPAVHRTRMKLMEFFASRCDGLIQIDGSGFYHQGRLLLRVAQAQKAQGVRFSHATFVLDGAEDGAEVRS